MPNILTFNPSTGAVIDYRLSVDEQPYLGRTDVLFQPTLPDCPRQYWIVDSGAVREMTEAEKVSFYPPYKPTSDEILAAKLATGFHDATTGHYLAIEEPDMEMWGMVQSGLNTALLTGAMTAASPFPGAIWGGTAANPNARNVPITGTCGEILGLVFRAMLEFQARHAAAKMEAAQ